MVMVVCVDEKNGMLFHHRRQSQDQFLRDDILKECGDKVLHMNAYSASMFGNVAEASVRISENFLEKAGKNEYCFVEDKDVSGYQEDIEAVILYKWNRRYPADVYFTLDLTDESWTLVCSAELKGSSHNRITKEVYKRIR